MKKNIIFATLLVILTAGETAFAQSIGDKHIQDSLKMLLVMRTIKCDLRIESIVDGKNYTAWGNYAEQVLPQASPVSFLRSMYRLEIYFLPNTPMTSEVQPNSMTLVCYASEDGGKHRIERCTVVEGKNWFSTIDLKVLEERLKATNREIFFSHVSEVRNLGGLAGMMRQINRFYEFSPPAQEELHDEETVPAWKLTGTLRSVHRKDLLTRFGGLNKKGQYPPDFPSDIEIWLGRHNDFPYKVRYLRRTAENSEQKELLFQETLYKVVLNGPPIPAARFDPLKVPEGMFSKQDETEDFIKTLELY